MYEWCAKLHRDLLAGLNPILIPIFNRHQKRGRSVVGIFMYDRRFLHQLL